MDSQNFFKIFRFKLLSVVFVFSLFSCGEKKDEDGANNNITSQEPPKEIQLFTQKSPNETGLYFINEVDETAYRNILLYQYYYNGGGVALGDVNNDGKVDIFLTANLSSNKLYLNKGKFQFEDVTLQAGLGLLGGASWCTGVTMVDINHDGYLDIYVCRSGNLLPENRKNLLFINNGDETFREDAAAYGLDDSGYSTQAVFFDYDKDGDLDMFLINHGLEYNGHPPAQATTARDPFVGDKLYENEGGRYIDVSSQAGILGTAEGYGLGVSIGDINNDGWDDIYVSNDFFEHDYLYINHGDGTFRETTKASMRQLPFFSMGVDIADFNNDGWQDVVALDMAIEDHRRQKENLAGITQGQFWQFIEKGYHYQYMYNSLQLNNGIGPTGELMFSNIARFSGVFQTDWSWAALFADFDNDGWKDLFVTNGLRKDVMNNDFINRMNSSMQQRSSSFSELSPVEAQKLLNQIPSEKVQNYIFQNQGGYRFENKANKWGLQEPSFSNGAAYADLDNDGDLDLVINNLDDFVGVFENNANKTQKKFLKIKVKGNSKNPFGIGTKVTLYKNDSIQFQQLNPTRGFQSSMEPILHFGANLWKEIDSIRVEWYDQKISVLKNVPTNQTIIVDYTAATPQPIVNNTSKNLKLFREITKDTGLKYRHKENQYDDFANERLLPRKFSSEGPCLASGDINGDGLDDFYIGGAKGQQGKLFIQGQNGDFVGSKATPWDQDAGSEDVAALFFDADQDGHLDLYVVSGSNEFGESSPLLQDRLYLNDGKGNFIKANELLPTMPHNTNCVVAADFDKDGDLDLFVGGGVVPGNYPFGGRSFLLENRDGKFVDVTAEKAPQLLQPGIVNDAIWSDYNQDGTMDLIVVGEWMPIAFFKNENSAFVQDSSFVKFSRNGEHIASGGTTGWWNCIVPIDVDQDGNMDYLLGNMGLNYRFRPSQDAPLEVYAGDFNQSGDNKIIIGYQYEGKSYPIHGREDLSTSIPSIKKPYNNYESYAKATISDILSVFPSQHELHLQAHLFENILLKNNGDGAFAIIPLPDAAQISSVQQILVDDFDRDGIDDALIVGNFYGIETKTPRDDAGLGLLLKGTSGGGLLPVEMRTSGFFAPLDARDLGYLKAKDSHILIVANNDADIQVFKVGEQIKSKPVK